MTTDRREFLKRSGLAAGGLALVSVNLSCITAMAPAMRVEISGSTIRFETDIPELSASGSAVSLESILLEHPIFLIRLPDRSFAALSSECTHRGCSVKKERSLLRCPCHDSGFDFEGKVLNGPAEEPLLRYPLTMHGTIAEIIV
jgi:Rieske Fe-S protein